MAFLICVIEQLLDHVCIAPLQGSWILFVRFPDDFGPFGNSKNEEKCGRVCSDSILSVRKITSISGGFWVGFGEGLGSILGGFWSHVGSKSRPKRMLKASSFRRRVSKPKKAEKSRLGTHGGVRRRPA